MQLPMGQKVYFLSDFHLGAPNYEISRQRENKLVSFFDQIKADAHTVFIVGDMFDFWFEYKHVVPKGYVRILGKLAEFTDAGIQVHFFVGNHDMWMKDYFQKELGIPVYYDAKTFVFNGQKFYIAHGDGLGPSDYGYKFMKKIFRNPFCQFLFGLLPPFIGMGLASYLSKKSRDSGDKEFKYLGEDKEWLIIYSKEVLNGNHYHYFVYGHRHVPVLVKIGEQSYYINLGDWMQAFTYAVFDGTHISLEKFVN